MWGKDANCFTDYFYDEDHIRHRNCGGEMAQEMTDTDVDNEDTDSDENENNNVN